MKYIHLDTDVKLSKELTKTVKLSDKEFLVASDSANKTAEADELMTNSQPFVKRPAAHANAIASLPWHVIKPALFFLSGLILMIFWFHG
ncbi:hypothetical protein VH441_04260 [Psychrobacter sp. HD31]|uniref:hypothetical protein n=1 Tax=Psychrobacter sp. HD31 TaxID=3112003 RepID=UPI003DA527FF